VTLQLVQDVFPNLTNTTVSGARTQLADVLKKLGHLNSESSRLELLAERYPCVENALMSVSRNTRNTATTLELLALSKTEIGELQEKATQQQGGRCFM
jgi:hypothetical protein